MSKKENVDDVLPGSNEEREILSAVANSYLDRQYDCKWKAAKIQRIKNNRVESEYEEKKQEFLVKGRQASELGEAWGFLVENNVAAINVVGTVGLQAKESEYNALGYNRMGVYLCRHADVCLQHALVKHSGSTVMRMVLCKFVAGRPTTAIPRVASAAEFIEPTQGFDCHESVIAPNPKDSLQNKFDRSQVYLYEINKLLQPSLRPRQVLPYAIIHFTQDGGYVPAIDAEPTPAEVAASQVTLIPTKLTQKAIPEPAAAPMSSPSEQQPGSTSSTPQSVKNGTSQSESPTPMIEPSKSTTVRHSAPSMRPRPPTPRHHMQQYHLQLQQQQLQQQQLQQQQLQQQQLQQQQLFILPGGQGLLPGGIPQPRGIPPGYALLTANGQLIYGGGAAPAAPHLQAAGLSGAGGLVQVPGGYAYAMMPPQMAAPPATAPSAQASQAYLQALQANAGLQLKYPGLQPGMQVGLPGSAGTAGLYGALPSSLSAGRSPAAALAGSRPITPEIPTAGYVANNVSGYTPAMMQGSSQAAALGVGGQPIPVIANGSVSAAQTASSYVQPSQAVSYYVTPTGAIAAIPTSQPQVVAAAAPSPTAQAQQLSGFSYINPYGQAQIVQQPGAAQKMAYTGLTQLAQAGLMQAPAAAMPMQGYAVAQPIKRQIAAEPQAVIAEKRLRLQ